MTPHAHVLLCKLLALSFTSPDIHFADSLKGLVGELDIELWDEDSQGLPILPIAPFIRALATFDKQMIEQAQQEYTRLFVENHSDALCSAHEWVYCLDMPRASVARTLQATYASWGQHVSTSVATCVETELEFLSILWDLSDNKAAQCARQDFLRQHALRWLPRFAADVTECTRLDFYRAAAQLLAAFLKIESGVKV